MNYFQDKVIVVPVDFSEPSSSAVNRALELSENPANLKIFHAVVPIPTLSSIDPAMPIPTVVDHDRLEDTQRHLENVFKDDRYHGVEIHCEIGDPGATIAEFAKEKKADLIVMPSHGRTGLDRMLLGSVAERVLRLAKCPVLILRSET